MASTIRVKYDLILALCSQIFEYVRVFFTGMPWSTLNRLVKKNKIKKEKNLWKHLTVIDLKARGWSGRIFAASASPRTN